MTAPATIGPPRPRIPDPVSVDAAARRVTRHALIAAMVAANLPEEAP